MNVPLSLVIGIATALLGIVGALIILNLKAIKNCLRAFTDRIDKQDSQIETTKNDLKDLYKTMAACKIDCDRNTVSKEDWVRSEGFTRRELKDVAGTLNRIEGRFSVVEKIPEICGGIVREVVTQLNNGGQ